MILTCPSCATRYFVKDGAVPPGGRTVRCASCGEEWRALADDAAMELRAPAGFATPLSAGAGEAAAEAATPKAFRAKAAAQRQTRQAMAAGVAWAGLTAVFVVLAFTAVLFRAEVVRAFPRANAAYAALRMPVNPVGLAIDAVTSGVGLENGRQVLVVQGAVRNIEAGPRSARPLRVALYDKGGRRAAAQVSAPGGRPLAPGEARTFRVVFFDPPLDAAEVGVDFDWSASAAPADGRKPVRRPSSRPAPLPAKPLRVDLPQAAAAAPFPAHVAEARPLPAESPYALAPATRAP